MGPVRALPGSAPPNDGPVRRTVTSGLRAGGLGTSGLRGGGLPGQGGGAGDRRGAYQRGGDAGPPRAAAAAHSTVQSVSVSMSLTYSRFPARVGCVQVELSATS